MRGFLCACLVGAGLLVPTAGANAQSKTPLAPHEPACPPNSQQVKPGEDTGSGNLSDKLSDSKGVICPPAGVDPGISTSPPGGGRMPVIPPPGTPGGDPHLQPK